MLDTNAVSALVDGCSPWLDGWFAEQRCCLSVIVAVEIRYGLGKKALNARRRQLIEAWLARLEVLPWTGACAVVYGRVRAERARKGRPLGLMDLLIASHALSVDELTLEAW